MDVREKLVELVHTIYNDPRMEFHDLWEMNQEADTIAEIMIENSVTVQEWVSVKDRLPQDDLPFEALCEIVQVLLDDGTVTVGWFNRGLKCWYYMPINAANFVGHDYENTPVIAWQSLAQPPKGK